MSNLKHTPLNAAHLALNAKIVDFAGWAMPVNYGSQVEEHLAVRHRCGLFDVSHMTVIDIKGDDAPLFLRELLANDIAKLKTDGAALYSAMLNERGGVIDDLIVYRFSDYYRLVVNSATRTKDLAWMAKLGASYQLHIIERDDLAMLALQGPESQQALEQVLGQTLPALNSFHSVDIVFGDHTILVANTGYTGERGYEMLADELAAKALWQALVDEGVQPCGLGARDTLRLEAGLNLYGHEMDDTISPLEANMTWTVDFNDQDRRFSGRDALEAQMAKGIKNRLVGVKLETKGVIRAGYELELHTNDGIKKGVVTSGSFSPTLNQSIALARVPNESFERASVLIRSKNLPVKLGKPCFVRHGQVVD